MCSIQALQFALPICIQRLEEKQQQNDIDIISVTSRHLPNKYNWDENEQINLWDPLDFVFNFVTLVFSLFSFTLLLCFDFCMRLRGSKLFMHLFPLVSFIYVLKLEIKFFFF